MELVKIAMRSALKLLPQIREKLANYTAFKREEQR
jgi:hypothetical protein